LLKKQKWPKESVNIMKRRIIQAAAFLKLFTSDRNPELRVLRGISHKIKR
jgi:hypothetical protein